MSVPRLSIRANDFGGAHVPTLQVIHDIECPLANGYAESTARMFAKVTGKSAHKCVGPDAVALCVPLDSIAWHCGPNGNRGSIGYEQCGYARFSRADWLTPAGRTQLANLAAELAADGLRYGIPDRHLTDAQLATWARNGRRAVDGGRVTHDQVHRVLGGTTHTDPMPNYPFDVLNPMVTRARAGQPLQEEEDEMALFADRNDFKKAVREVLNEGTAPGQGSWADTSEATLRTVQGLVNLVNADAAQGRALGAALTDARTAVLAAIAALPTAGMSEEEREALAASIATKVSAAGLTVDAAAIGEALGADLASRLAA